MDRLKNMSRRDFLRFVRDAAIYGTLASVLNSDTNIPQAQSETSIGRKTGTNLKSGLDQELIQGNSTENVLSAPTEDKTQNVEITKVETETANIEATEVAPYPLPETRIEAYRLGPISLEENFELEMPNGNIINVQVLPNFAYDGVDPEINEKFSNFNNPEFPNNEQTQVHRTNWSTRNLLIGHSGKWRGKTLPYSVVGNSGNEMVGGNVHVRQARKKDGTVYNFESKLRIAKVSQVDAPVFELDATGISKDESQPMFFRPYLDPPLKGWLTKDEITTIGEIPGLEIVACDVDSLEFHQDGTYSFKKRMIWSTVLEDIKHTVRNPENYEQDEYPGVR